MKFNRFFLSVALGVACCLGAAAPAVAQVPGLYSPASIQAGGTVVIAPASTNVLWTYILTNGVQTGVIITNTYNWPASNSVAQNTNLLSVNIPEYDYVGITWSYTSGSNATLNVYASRDNGQTYGTTPIFTSSGSAAASTAWITNALIDVHGASTLGFAIQNPSTVPITNLLTEINLKATRIWKMEAGANNGVTPGPVTHVPGFN